MMQRPRTVAGLALILASLGVLASCGDEGPTGPQFGDLVFSPSFVSLPGDDRTAAFMLQNRGPRDLSSIVLGFDIIVQTAMPDSLCTGPEVNFVPSGIASLAQGADQALSVTLDMSSTTTALCPAAQYDALLFAAANGQALGGATIRFNWDGTPP